MTPRIETIAAQAPLSELVAVFDKGHVAIVVDSGRFVGLITRIDLINHLRRKVD
jgi:cystathionine beta-synthase